MRHWRPMWVVVTAAMVVAGFVANHAPAAAALDDQEQRDYRWYDDVYSPPDKPQPSTPFAAENTAITDVANAAVLHARINVHSGPGMQVNAVFPESW